MDCIFIFMGHIFIHLFLTFQVLFGVILDLRFFAIVLNYYTTANKHFVGFSSGRLLTEAYLVLFVAKLNQVALMLSAKYSTNIILTHRLISVECKYTKIDYLAHT